MQMQLFELELNGIEERVWSIDRKELEDRSTSIKDKIHIHWFTQTDLGVFAELLNGETTTEEVIDLFKTIEQWDMTGEVTRAYVDQ